MREVSHVCIYSFFLSVCLFLGLSVLCVCVCVSVCLSLTVSLSYESAHIFFLLSIETNMLEIVWSRTCIVCFPMKYRDFSVKINSENTIFIFTV